MVEMLLGGKFLQYWQQLKPQVMGLPILGVLDEDEESSKEVEENDKEKRKRNRGRVLQQVL
eukprot:6463329-Ditylum_brightwellii.AAC.1